MRRRDEDTWWRRTAVFAAAILIAAGTFAILPFLAEGLFSGADIFGLPAGLLLTAIGAPLVGLIALAFFTRRQIAIDRRYDVAEH